jgi:alpha-beta hydrolase superfamily lysophospholipase
MLLISILSLCVSFIFAAEWTTEHDNVRVYYNEWIPKGEVKSRVVAVNGLGDRIERYGEMFSSFVNAGIYVVGIGLHFSNF